MIYVISKSTFGDYSVRDIQYNANWDCCPYFDYALIPDNLVDGILATRGYCDITLNSAGTEVVSFTARSIPSVPEECHGVNTVLSVNGACANADGEVTLDAAAVGAAPAGYGLGFTEAFDFAEIDNIKANGWYACDVGSSGFTIFGIWFRFVHMRVDMWDFNSVRQTLYPVLGSNVILMRECFGNTWGEWECVNPPMTEGVEYRTTERWNGKVVWTQLIDFGALPNNTPKLKSCASFTQLCDSVCNVTDGTYYSNANKEPWVTGFNVSSGQILLRTNTDVSAYTATVQLWYVKD